MNIVVGILMLLSCVNYGFTQDLDVKNEKLEFSLLMQTIDDEGRPIAPKYFVFVDSKNVLEDSVSNEYLNELVKLLDSDESDWAASHLLYYYTGTEYPSLIILTEDLWRSSKREQDIAYWRATIKKT